MDKPLQVLQGFILNTSLTRRPLVAISRDEWERLSQVTGNSGTINSYFADKQAYALNLNLWPAPDSTEVLNTATFLMRVQAKNPILLTDNTAFPQEWRMALRWGLADDICTGQPESIMNRCQQRATAYRTALENFDVEDTSTRFNVDSRFYNTAGRFR
jgi:hypothetical protein